MTKHSFPGTKTVLDQPFYDSKTSQVPLGERFFLIPNLYFFGVFLLIATFYNLTHPTLENIVLTCFFRIVIGFTYTSVLASIYWKKRIFELPKLQIIGKSLVIAGLMFIPANIVYLSVESYLEPVWFETTKLNLQNIITVRALLLLAWHVYYIAIYRMQTAKELELEILKNETVLLESQLRFLQSQLNPHFLLNSLNTLIANSANKKTVETIATSLAGYLKYSLQENEITTELGKELDALEKFLSLQSARMDQTISYSITCNPRLRKVKIPSRMLQPLVENAVRYGSIEPLSASLKISISISNTNGMLYFIVQNSGSWADVGSSDSSGLGIKNLLKQLNILIGPEALLKFTHQQNHVTATIQIPEIKLKV